MENMMVKLLRRLLMLLMIDVMMSLSLMLMFLSLKKGDDFVDHYVIVTYDGDDYADVVNANNATDRNTDFFF